MPLSHLSNIIRGTICQMICGKEPPANPIKPLLYGSQIAIRAFNGKYVQVNHHHTQRLMAREPHIHDWELFEIVSAENPFSYIKEPVRFGDKIALKAISNNLFVHVFTSQPQIELGAIAPIVKETEVFILKMKHAEKSNATDNYARYGCTVALETLDHHLITCDDTADGRLRTKSSILIDEAETFVLIHPQFPK